MIKKITILAVISVILLSTASFTTVIGSKIDTKDVKETPMFNIRTQRAAEYQSEDISNFNYIGEGELNIPVLKLQSLKELLLKQENSLPFGPTNGLFCFLIIAPLVVMLATLVKNTPTCPAIKTCFPYPINCAPTNYPYFAGCELTADNPWFCDD